MVAVPIIEKYYTIRNVKEWWLSPLSLIPIIRFPFFWQFLDNCFLLRTILLYENDPLASNAQKLYDVDTYPSMFIGWLLTPVYTVGFVRKSAKTLPITTVALQGRIKADPISDPISIS